MNVGVELWRGRIARAILVTVALLSFVACGADRDLLVFAATSLREPLTEVSERYERESGLTVDLSFGASQSVAQQIASGAPADVFVSAGQAPVLFLEERGLASSADSERLLGNELVVVTLKSGGAIDSLEALTSEEIDRVAMANPAIAPAGAYAEEALRTAGVWDRIQDKLLFGKDVRAAMTYVEVGNADAGIVYGTDARSSDSLKVARAVEANLHSPIVYPAVAVSDSTNQAGASDYLEYLSSEEAMSVFRQFGFSDPPVK